MYTEVLPEANKALLAYLKQFSDFTLAGGTALALQLGHRQSIDFDFFSSNYIDKKLWNKLKKVFSVGIIPLAGNEHSIAVNC